MPDANLTPEQEAAQKELDAILQSDDYRKGDSWTQQAAAERALEARRVLLGDRNEVVLHVGPPPERDLPEALKDLPARADGQAWSRPKLWAMADAATEFHIAPDEVRSRLLAAQGTTPLTMEEAEEHLRKTWGPQYEARLAAAQLVFNRLPSTLQQELDETGQGNDPETIRWFAERGQPLLEAQAKIDAILADLKHPYWRSDPQAIEEVRRLHVIVHGTRKA